MAPSFLLLPPEIRVKIYHYFLQDVKISFDIEHKTPFCRVHGQLHLHSIDKSRMIIIKNTDIPRSNNLALLSTCRRIYIEASTLLYENLCFHRTPWSTFPNPSKRIVFFFPPGKLDQIRNIHFTVDHTITSKSPQNLVEMLHLFQTANCSLKRLTLEFLCMNKHTRSNWLHVDESLYQSLTKDGPVAKALECLSISEEIKIELKDQILKAARRFEPFVRTIAKARGWGCYEDSDLDGTGDGEIEALEKQVYHWCWYLRPLGNPPIEFRSASALGG